MFILTVVASLMIPVGCARCGGPTAKTALELDDEERGALSALVRGAYEEAGSGRACFIYENTYFFMPLPDRGRGRELDPPLVLLGQACIGPHMSRPETIRVLERHIASRGVSWIGSNGRHRSLEIGEGFVLRDYGGAGGSLGMSNDMATIVPIRLVVR